MAKEKTLIIVESPTKAKKIESFLSDNFIVMSCKGHITELAKGGKHGLGVDIDNKFKPKYVISDDKIEVVNQLLKVGKSCNFIMLAPDLDREGTAIAWHLSQRLADLDKPMKRIEFNEIKKNKILEAINNPKDIDMNVVASQEARRILDRIVGFMASPFLMNFFGQNLSAGRVQSVLARMIIDREAEIDAFIPETFYTIQVNLSKDGKQGFTTKYSGKLSEQKPAEDMKNKLSAAPEYIVTEVLAAEEKVFPQAPLVTSTLQRLMSKTHGIAADATMKAAQALYEMGHCTYIRTDSVRVGDEALSEVRDWIKANNYALPKKAHVYKNKNDSQDAHECIRPSNISVLPTDGIIVDPIEKLVYEMIWKYFIASQMMPAVYNTLKITAHVKGDPKAEVKTSGKALKTLGYLEILGTTDNSQIDIPNLVKGDILNLFGKTPVKLEKKQTQPPPRFSEDKLIKELESKNIGRPATYADLLSKITARNYVEKKGNVYHPTDLGKKITKVLTEYFTFMDYNYTSKMELLLDEIESGKVDHVEMLSKFYSEFKKELDKAYLNQGGELCEKCGAPMATRINKKKGEKFLGCSKYPSCKNVKSLN